MMDARPFHFKHFSMYHHRSTMKIGTDAVLLGRWVEVNPSDVVLDIGTGCGILPMMLAQKGVAQVDAVDLDVPSVEEAGVNFAASQWRDKLNAICADIRAYRPERRYDLIVSNPPFFIHSYQCDAGRKTMARHTDMSLSFCDLCQSVVDLLRPEGRFALVLPVAESVAFLKEAESHGLFLRRKMEIIPVEGKASNRVNMEMQKTPAEVVQSVPFVIRDAANRFTAQYHDFLQDFYLG